MKRRQWMLLGCMLLLMFAVTACGSKKEQPTTEEEATFEEVTEFQKDQETISIKDIMEGLNFKAKGTSVTFEFEDIKQFDNSMHHVFALMDAVEGETKELEISNSKKAYTFDGLNAGEDYYLDIYPTKAAGSETEANKIQKNNQKCRLKLVQ